MSQLLWIVGPYLGLGLLTTLLYAYNWRVFPRWRHIACWPLVAYSMVWGECLPRWLKPAGGSMMMSPPPQR